MEVGDLVKQKSSGAVFVSSIVKDNLNMDCVGIVIGVENGIYFSYDGRDRHRITVRWSNGNIEVLPEIYLEKVEGDE